MHIKLSTNSREAKNYISELGLDCRYSYTYGLGKNDELNKDNSWGVKLFYGIEKILSRTLELSQHDKELLNNIIYSAEYLNSSFTKEDSDYISDMNIVLNVKSRVNTLIQKSVNLIGEVAPIYASKLEAGVDHFVGVINPFNKKMIIGSSLFETNNSNDLFIPYLQEKLGLEKAVEFVILHEASHAFEKTNMNKYGFLWDDRISEIVLLSHELNYVSKSDGTTTVEKLNEAIKQKLSGKFPLIDMDYFKDIATLESEIYADVSSILLCRNKDIEKGTYSKGETLKLLNTVIQARCKEQQFSAKNSSPDKSASIFDHFTAQGLAYFRGIIETIPEQQLTQKDIFKYAKEASKVGLARTIISSYLANPENGHQINMIFNLQYEPGDEPLSLPNKMDSSISYHKFQMLVDLAGNTWYQKNIEKAKAVKISNPLHKINSIWRAITDIDSHIQKIYSEQNDSRFLVKPKDGSLDVMSALRNNSKTIHQIKNKP